MTNADALLDYHVGIMRGYLLAMNAPQQVLHALDVLLTGYVSRAGQVIGAPNSESEIRIKQIQVVASPKLLAAPKIEDKLRNTENEKPHIIREPWTADDDEIIISMKKTGASTSDIILKLPARTQGAIYTRIHTLKCMGKLS